MPVTYIPATRFVDAMHADSSTILLGALLYVDRSVLHTEVHCERHTADVVHLALSLHNVSL